jgi:nucleoside-diphosphate-sugar epimerase
MSSPAAVGVGGAGKQGGEAKAVAFVAGATGFVGRAVVPGLVARGATTIAHVRPDSRELADWQRRFGEQGARVDTTGWDEAALTATFRREGVTHVFCLIGTTRGRAKKDGVVGDIYEVIDVGLTRMLAAAASACGTRPRFVYLSSVGASARSSSAYLRARARAEALAQGAGVPWVIARPSMIVGPGRDDRRPMERAAGAVGDGLLAVVGVLGGKRLRAAYRSTTPAILAGALVSAGLDGAPDRILAGDDLR